MADCRRPPVHLVQRSCKVPLSMSPSVQGLWPLCRNENSASGRAECCAVNWPTERQQQRLEELLW